MKHILKSLLLLSALLAAGACQKDLNGGKADGGDQADGLGFNFSTVSQYEATIDFGIRARVPFAIYTENPFGAEGILKDGLKPVFRGYTDEAGYFTTARDENVVTIPSHYENLWVYSDFPGAVMLREVKAGDFSLSNAPVSLNAASRAAENMVDYLYDDLKGRKFYVMDGYKWSDQTGRPNAVMAEKFNFTSDFLSAIHAVFHEGRLYTQDMVERYPEFFTESKSLNVLIKEEAPVTMTFIHTITNYNDCVGYYTYRQGETPSWETLRRTVVFPLAKYGTLGTGEQVKLKYWNPDTQAWQDNFPAGTVIGLWICPNGVNVGWEYRVHGYGGCFTTDTPLNDVWEGGAPTQQAVALYDKDHKMVIIGFEDMFYNEPTVDRDYNDVVVGIVSEGIDPDHNNPLPPYDFDPESNKLEYSGTLAFEDLWPNHGDYDMNDVVLTYHCVVWRNIHNKVERVQDEFRPIHTGATFNNGFGYQYGLHESAIASVEREFTYGYPASFDLYESGPLAGIEKGHNSPDWWMNNATIMLFDNVNAPGLINKANPHSFKVTTRFKYPIEMWQLSEPPYNPFIVVRNGVDADTRGKEVHLAYKYPTALCNGLFFGYHPDCSLPSQRRYYVSDVVYEHGLNIAMPYAINFPGEFTWKEERNRIDERFPNFKNWVASNGWQYKDWWKE